MHHDPKKLNGLRGAIHDLADEYDAQKNPEFAETLRTVSNDPAMLHKFADLLVHYDTPAAAAHAMQTEGAKRATAPMIHSPGAQVETNRGEFIDMASSDD